MTMNKLQPQIDPDKAADIMQQWLDRSMLRRGAWFEVAKIAVQAWVTSSLLILIWLPRRWEAWNSLLNAQQLRLYEQARDEWREVMIKSWWWEYLIKLTRESWGFDLIFIDTKDHNNVFVASYVKWNRNPLYYRKYPLSTYEKVLNTAITIKDKITILDPNKFDWEKYWL